MKDGAKAGAKATGRAGVAVVVAVASIPGNIVAGEEARERDHEIAVGWFQQAGEHARRDECADVMRLMGGVRDLDPHYYESVIEDSNIAWCTVRGKGVSEKLARLARDFALRADCEGAIAVSNTVLREDRRYYALVYLREPAIVACWLSPHTLPTRGTDGMTMQFAIQARNAARRLDCRGARASLSRMRDGGYRDAFVASRAFEACR